MSESNSNWVCFKCRTAARQPKTADTAARCRICGGECVCIGYKTPIPQKSDVKAWTLLEQDARLYTAAQADTKKQYVEAEKHSLMLQIEKLEQMDENKDRSRLIKELKNKLEKLIS